MDQNPCETSHFLAIGVLTQRWSTRRDSQSAVSLQDPVVRVEACAIRLRTEGLGFNGLWVLWYVGVRGSRDRGAAVLRCRWPSRYRNEFRVGQGVGSMGTTRATTPTDALDRLRRADCSA